MTYCTQMKTSILPQNNNSILFCLEINLERYCFYFPHHHWQMFSWLLAFPLLVSAKNINHTTVNHATAIFHHNDNHNNSTLTERQLWARAKYTITIMVHVTSAYWICQASSSAQNTRWWYMTGNVPMPHCYTCYRIVRWAQFPFPAGLMERL